ncbi:hypothetical protein BDN72DRAFT_223988 [Pluteus cervinus]|uniref:Uncharacterized protein n=1 Tax=Pluteus cervinus TaxID=181527 RepID=A0ACD3BE33_9AGAR|nr:hypothetical protein BDN72DRAFT_223988 [Pluteus cervinus]
MTFRLNAVLWILVLTSYLLPSYSSRLGERELPRLSADAIRTLVTTPDPVKNIDPNNAQSHLTKILIPRAPGTENNTFVRNYIISTMKNLKWHVDLDEFDGDTPAGPRHFVNVIATKDPEASRRVILSAHFDSKYFPTAPDNQFVGATDSAAPCAMMLDLAEALDPLLDDRKQRMDNGFVEDEEVADTTLQLIFFDGEEAFAVWTDTDSIYGARHLAETWATTYVQPNQKRKLVSAETYLSGIEHLILLDLLGAPDPSIRSFFLDTAWLFDALKSSEQRLGDSGAFTYGDSQSMAKENWKTWLRPRTNNVVNYGFIGDDHVPFLKRGVDILHLIAEPFPRVWHKLSDNADALDIPTMRRWNLMLRVFMAEYLHLQPPSSNKERDSHTIKRIESEL